MDPPKGKQTSGKLGTLRMPRNGLELRHRQQDMDMTLSEAY
jgi:hypothetical protein